MISVAMLADLEWALNTAITLDRTCHRRLKALHGRVIGLHIRGVTTLYILPTTAGLRLMHHYDDTPDTLLSGGPLTLLRMVCSGSQGGGLFNGDITIDGDVELGQRIQHILQNLEIDWEERLSYLTGDIIAHQIGSGLRGLRAWGEQARAKLGSDIGDYLQEEAELLPTVNEVEETLIAIDRLRTDSDRLEVRLHRLEKEQVRH